MLAESCQERFNSAAQALEQLPVNTKAAKVIQASHRVPDTAEVPQDFIALRQAKINKKRKEEEAARKAQLEKEDAVRRAKDEEERRRIKAERIRADLRDQGSAICTELEGAWELGIADISGQSLTAEDLLEMIHKIFNKKMQLQEEDIIHVLHHPIFSLSRCSKKNTPTNSRLGYLKWILETQCAKWSEQTEVQELQETLEYNTLQSTEKEKEINALSWFASFWSKPALQKELVKITEQRKNCQSQLEKAKKDYINNCMEVFWKPFFDVDYSTLLKKAQSYTFPQSIFGTLSRNAFSRELKKGEIVYPHFKKVVYPFIGIPSGSFMMGGVPNDSDRYSNEKPRHKVKISKGFWMAKHPVTQSLYKAVMNKNPSQFKGAHRPVERVTWCNAIVFCNKLSELEGLTPC